MKNLLEMFQFTWWGKWVGFQFTPYTYDGNDGRRVTDWMAYFGWFSITKTRIAN
jgi:hypothetical protein